MLAAEEDLEGLVVRSRRLVETSSLVGEINVVFAGQEEHGARSCFTASIAFAQVGRAGDAHNTVHLGPHVRAAGENR